MNILSVSAVFPERPNFKVQIIRRCSRKKVHIWTTNLTVLNKLRRERAHLIIPHSSAVLRQKEKKKSSKAQTPTAAGRRLQSDRPCVTNTAALCGGGAASAPGGPTRTIIFHSWVRHTAALWKCELGGREDSVGRGEGGVGG